MKTNIDIIEIIKTGCSTGQILFAEDESDQIIYGKFDFENNEVYAELCEGGDCITGYNIELNFIPDSLIFIDEDLNELPKPNNEIIELLKLAIYNELIKKYDYWI